MIYLFFVYYTKLYTAQRRTNAKNAYSQYHAYPGFLNSP